MSDPAVEAAYRAWPHMDKVSDRLMIAAAREALKPIRELHERANGGTPTGEPADICHECRDFWPCATARLVYTEEELS